MKGSSQQDTTLAPSSSAFVKLTTVVCYAPTEDAEEEGEDAFYDSLQRMVDKTP